MRVVIPFGVLCLLVCTGCSANPVKTDVSAGTPCEQFMALKNAGDPNANDLLGPAPSVPSAPVSEEEADRLDADYILHGPLHILEVRRQDNGDGPPRCLLVTEGAYTCPKVPIRGGGEPASRHLGNPDLLVEVRDGKIYGVRVQLHLK
jgi:hypothetical protein